MNVLVTGGAGFIGSNVIQHIINFDKVQRLVNLDCLTYAGHLANVAGVRSNPKYVFSKTDLRDREAVGRVIQDHQITSVIHLAAESHVDRSISGPADFVTTNILGTFNLLEACREYWLGKSPDAAGSSGPRFVHVSTDEVYGSLGETGYFDEKTPYAPNSPYSASKASSDLLVRAYHKTYGLPAMITNCSNNYGPYQYPEKFIPVIIQSVIRRARIPVYGDGLNVRDWLYVRDHAEALWQVLTRGTVGESYNIGGQNEWPNIKILRAVCDLIDKQLGNLDQASHQLIEFVKDRPGHDRRYAVDAGKIERELSWRPRVTFAQGLNETVQWYLKNQDWVGCVSKQSQNPDA